MTPDTIGQFGLMRHLLACPDKTGVQMPKQQKTNNRISVNITGDVSGQIVIGNNNEVKKSIAHLPTNSANMKSLLRLLNDLKFRIQTEAPDDKKEDALEKANELANAIHEKNLYLVDVGYVKKWFEENLPDLVELITRIEDEFGKLSL